MSHEHDEDQSTVHQWSRSMEEVDGSVLDDVSVGLMEMRASRDVAGTGRRQHVLDVGHSGDEDLTVNVEDSNDEDGPLSNRKDNCGCRNREEDEGRGQSSRPQWLIS